jgi:hypothetical protein
MTVSSTTSRITYAGNGSTTAFAVPFYFLADSDLVVIKTNSVGVSTTQVLSTNYTVSGSGVSSGGTVTCTVAPATGETLIIYRDPAVTQLTDYQANDPFPAETHERALDKLTMITQRLKDKLARSFVLSDGDASGASTTLPTPQANKLVGWNSSGTGLENVDASTLATSVAYGNATAEVFTGDGSTTTFVMSNNPGVDGNLDVSVGGVTQIVNINFTWSGTNITFTTAPASGVKVLVRYMQGVPVAYSTPIPSPVSVTGSTTTYLAVTSASSSNTYEVAVRTGNANYTWSAGINSPYTDGSWVLRNVTSGSSPIRVAPSGAVTINAATASSTGSLAVVGASGYKTAQFLAIAADVEVQAYTSGDYNCQYSFYAGATRQFKIGIRAGTSGTWSIYDVVRTADTLAVSSSGTVSIAAPAANAAGFTCNGSASTPAIAVTFSATAMTVDCSRSNVFTTTFTANVTTAPTISNPQDGQTINWFITQDGTGSRTMTWPTSFKWAGGSAGTLTTTANAVDLLVATYRSATSAWYCTLSKGFA